MAKRYFYIANKCKIPSEIDTEVSEIYVDIELCKTEGKLLLKDGFDVVLIVELVSEYGETEIIERFYR
jgi:hypothetical protein